MSYIGKQPTKAPLTASDIEDGIITAAKIEDGAVVAAEIASNAVTTAKINADAVTGAKIADDAINSEHYTDGSVDTAHIADANVTTAKIAADAITAAKIADDAISEEHLDATVITGMTELAAEPADTDEFLISDAGTLKRIDYSHIKSGGSWVLLDTQTASGNPSTLESGAVFSATYDTYVMIIRRINLQTNGGLSLYIGTSSSFVTSGYKFGGSGVAGGANDTYSGSAGDIPLLGGTSSAYHCNTTADCLSGVIWFHNPFNDYRTSIHGEMSWENASDLDASINNFSAHPNTSASYDRWKLAPSSGTFQSNTIIQTFGVVNA